MKLKELKEKCGFTLVELIVVAIIIGILTAVGLPLYLNYIKEAKVSAAKNVIGTIVRAEKQYYQKHGIFINVDQATFEGDPTANCLGVDVRDATQFWTLVVESADTNKFEVLATGKAGTDYADITVKLEYFLDRPEEWII